jgi:hypothetical protein
LGRCADWRERMSPKPEQEWNAHYRCTFCHAVRPKADIIHHLGQPFCADRLCKEDYHALFARPVPRSVGYYDKG